MTIAVALSLALATAGLLLQLLGHFRDRPELSVHGDTTVTQPNGPYVLHVDVANRGKRPTTIMEVGLEVSGGAWFVDIKTSGEVNLKRSDVAEIKPGDRRTIPLIRLSHAGSVRLLQPGEVAIYEWEPTAAIFPVDSPLRPYATDSHGRQSWGEAQPFLRRLRNAGWHPGTEAPPRKKPAVQPLHAAPIAAVWQLWKPRQQRGSWRRHADYRIQQWRRSAMRTGLTPAGLPPRTDYTNSDAASSAGH